MRYQLGRLLHPISNLHLFVLDAIIFAFTPLLALTLRLDGLITAEPFQSGLIPMTVALMVIKLALFSRFGFYRHYWRYAGTDELLKTTMLTLAATLLNSYCFLFFTQMSWVKLPQSLPLLDGLLSLVCVGTVRVVARAWANYNATPNQRTARTATLINVLVVGADQAGTALVQDMQHNPQYGYHPIAFIDDEPTKLNLTIQGLKVVGDRHAIPAMVKALNIDRVIIAMPQAAGPQIRDVLAICQATGVQTTTLPSIHELMREPVQTHHVRDIRIEDLLRREPIRTDYQGIYRFIKGKRVLVTGAGGAMGDELCRQLLKCLPAEIILLDSSEQAIDALQHALHQELAELNSTSEIAQTTQLTAFIGDLRSRTRIANVFERHRPDVVFHTAAYEHIPLMELNVPEAVTHNVLGTQNLVDMAIRYNTSHVVMTSTDKVVNPTSVVGASKRIAEMVVLQAAQLSRKPYCVLRCGTLLGNRGGVLALFEKQIASGGPITVTHPDASCYFMTLTEAVQLTLQVAVLSKSNEIFVANIGEPIKIVDLAQDLIRLSGYQVGTDITLSFTGLRPGEKLYEERLVPGEEYATTSHPKLMVVRNAQQIVSDTLPVLIKALGRVAQNNDVPMTLSFLRQILPTYQPAMATQPPQRPTPQAAPPESANAIQPLDRSILQTMPMVGGQRLTRRQMTTALHQALRQQEFRLLYQPIFALQNVRRLNGFEALLRWEHPTWGVVTPPTFIQLAESTGLIVPIGWWVLDEVCRELRSWQDQHQTQPATVSINLSGQQLLHPELVARFTQSLDTYGLTGSCLRVEVSDDLIRGNMLSMLKVLMQLQSLGVQVQIDRYGGGQDFYSGPLQIPSLSYDHFDCLKIDHLLVHQINQNADCLARMHEILAQAQELGIDLIATGVETAAQLAKLKSLNCDYGQGFYLAKPVMGEAAKVLYETSDRVATSALSNQSISKGGRR